MSRYTVGEFRKDLVMKNKTAKSGSINDKFALRTRSKGPLISVLGIE